MKNFSIIVFTMYSRLNHILKVVWGIVSLHIPIKKNVVCFDSFGGQYNDNPKYVSEELHRQCPNITIVWNHSGKGKDILPNYVKIVDNSTYKGRMIFNTAQVVVDNHTGIRSGMCYKNNIIQNIFYKLKNIKRKGQLCISTFHGTPLKRIAMDEPGAHTNFVFYSSTNYVLSGCKYTSECFRTAFENTTEIREYGTPRNDIFFNDKISVNNLKLKLGLPLDKKVVLYAPTFRNDTEISGVIQIKSIDFTKLFLALSDTFGGQWCFVFRAHNLVQQKINFDLLQKNNPMVELINGNQHDDMAEYLKCTDILITDYSASMFDFALTQRPCFLYAPDVNEYGRSERGFYRNIKSLPFPVATDFKDLIEAIVQFDKERYAHKVCHLLDEIGNMEDGKATKRVVEDILAFIKTSNS